MRTSIPPDHDQHNNSRSPTSQPNHIHNKEQNTERQQTHQAASTSGYNVPIRNRFDHFSSGDSDDTDEANIPLSRLSKHYQRQQQQHANTNEENAPPDQKQKNKRLPAIVAENINNRNATIAWRTILKYTIIFQLKSLN